ncbi:MAG TPA: phage baseplate assembly protein [Gammaproteobacteria bacterium]|nr:phage baseplate assembly protein [Gammaproteobacteria bacterium]
MQDVFDARGQIRHATVAAVDDSAAAQTVTVVTDEAGTYAQVPVATQWGFASNPPLRGLRAVLVALGGDPANWRAILTSVGRRLGGLSPGEVAMYANNGSRVALRQLGVVEVLAGSKVVITAATTVEVTAGTTVTITGPGGITLAGNVTVAGTLTVSGLITAAGGVTP